MIEKAEVRRRLAQYEIKLKKELQEIENEIKTMYDSCKTMKMERVWQKSEEYKMLSMKWQTLRTVLYDIEDIRCSELFNDY